MCYPDSNKLPNADETMPWIFKLNPMQVRTSTLALNHFIKDHNITREQLQGSNDWKRSESRGETEYTFTIPEVPERLAVRVVQHPW